MNIHITGRGDRRAVVYPLLYLLNRIDGALLLTDDAAYRRLETDEGGYIGNVRIRFGPGAEKSDYDISVLDYVLPVSEPGEGDETVWVRRAKDGEEFPGPARPVLVDFTRPPGKKDKTPFLPLSQSYLRELHDAEVSGRLAPLRSKAAARALSPVFGEILDISAKSVFLMLTKGGELT